MAEQKTDKYYYNQTKEAEKLKNAWWKEEEEVFTHVMGCARRIEKDLSYRAQLNVSHARLYSNQLTAALATNIYAKDIKTPSSQARLSLNVIKSCVDTVSSKIAKNKPKPLFLTTKGDFFQRQRAKKLTQYISGCFDRTKFYQKSQMAFRDCGIFGTGAIKLDSNDGQINAERILADEILVDETEGVYGKPRTIYQKKFIAREVLMSLFEDNKDEIMACQVSQADSAPAKSSDSDMLYVIEAWHLPSSKGAKDGKHTICIDNCTLLLEDYKKSYFPILFLYWTPPVVGFYGAGIAEEIKGIQLEVNKVLRDIQEAQHLMCAPSVWIENGSKVTKPINNTIANVYGYTGTKPTFYTPGAMSNEVYTHIWNLYAKAYQIVGVSELSASLKKPAGIESKVALREYNDIETERFALAAMAFEDFHMEAAEIMVDMSKDLFTKNKELKENVKGRRFIDTIEWKDVDMAEDEYIMDVFPVSFISGTPSAKMERVNELIESGLIEKQYALSLLDFPDVEQVVSLQTANLDIIYKTLDDIIENAIYNPPEPFMDLQLAVKVAQARYMQARVEDVPEARLEMIQRFIDQAIVLLQAAQQPVQTQTQNLPAPGPVAQPETAQQPALQ